MPEMAYDWLNEIIITYSILCDAYLAVFRHIIRQQSGNVRMLGTYSKGPNCRGPVVQNIVILTSSLLTHSLTVVATL